MAKKKILLWVILLFFCLLLLSSFNRIKLMASYVSLVSNTQISNNLNSSSVIEELEQLKSQHPDLTLGYAIFMNPFPGEPQFSLKKLPKIIMTYKNSEFTFLPLCQYGEKLYQWHCDQYKENPNFYPSQKDDRELLFQSYLDPYGYTKELYSAEPRSFFKVFLMPLEDLRNYVSRLKVKALQHRRAMFFETQNKTASCEFMTASDENYILVSIYWKDNQYLQSVLVKSQDNEKEIIGAVKILVSSFEIVRNIPEDRELLNRLITEAIEK